MTRLAENKIEDIIQLAPMLKQMYFEIHGDKAATDMSLYVDDIMRCLGDPKQAVFIDCDYRGFFIIQDESDQLIPEMPIYNGIRVFVKQQYRNSRVLKEFYDTMFKAFPNGTIMGLTAINSRHINVLEKRHERIANLYRLNRS